MSGGGGNQTVSQTSEPPAYAAPYLGEAATRSQWEYYNDFGRQYYPGQTVVGFSPETEQALQMQTQRAQQGSPVAGAAEQFTNNRLTQPITSQFGGATNPHLDATFNRAADSVQNRLGTQYASAGRNLGAMRNPQSQELNDLASQIYGGAYESERNRMASDIGQQRQQQTAALSMAPGISQLGYSDIDRLLQSGAMREDLTGRQYEDAAARYDFAQNQQGLALDQYIQRLNGMPGSAISSSTPVYRNYAAGGLGGAMAGQQIGSQIGEGYGGWGSLIGGIAGILGS